MSDYKTDRTDRTIPSGCPSPARVEKTDSSSSRQSGSPIYWDFESWIVSDSLGRTGRIRPSSWDDSDDDLSPKDDMSKSKASRIYSSESKEVKNSVSYEINKLKKEFFEALEKEKSTSHDGLVIEDLAEKLEIRLKCDRRQSPARVRRRSRSSSSSSPVPDTKCQNSPERREKFSAFDVELDGSDQMSPKVLETDSKYYLNNFFTELRSKRISMLDPVPMDKITEESILISDDMKLEMLNELSALEVNDDGGFFCKTSRKLSQILEVEENKRDLERSSEVNIQKSESIAGDSDKFSEKNFSIIDLTPRNNDSDKVLQKSEDIRRTKNENYKSFSFEKSENNHKVTTFSRDSLSERSARIFDRKLDDDFIHLCAKSGKTHLSSPRNNSNAENPFQFFCLTNTLGANKCFLGEPIPEKEDKGNESNVTERLEIDFDTPAVCESPTPGKSTDRSGQSQSSRTKSGKSKRSSNPQSPKFALSVGGEDSARSLREVNTTDSQLKSKRSIPSERKMSSSEDRSPRRSSKSSCRSEVASDVKTERNLRIQLESLSLDSGKSSPRSLYEQRTASRNSRSGRSSRRSQRSEKEKKDKTAERDLSVQNFLENTKTESPILSSRSPDKANTSSYRSEFSGRILTPVQYFSDNISDREIPQNQEIYNVEIPEIAEFQRMSSRSAKTGDLEVAVEQIDQSQPNTPSQRSSERSCRSERSKKLTARSLRRQIASKTSDSTFTNNIEPQETLPVPILQDFNLASDAFSSYTPIDSSRRRSSWRESDFPSRESSSRRGTFDRETEILGVRENPITPKSLKLTDERQFSSRKSSTRSADSFDKMTAAPSGNVTPTKSEKTKSRPSSHTSKESEFGFVPSEIEKIDVEALSGRSTTFEEEKEKEEISSIQGSQSGTESDRLSNKRLSVINEVSYEDFETVNNSENDERDFWGKSRPQSTVESRRNSPESMEWDRNSKTVLKDSSKASARSFKEKSESNFCKQITTEGSTWSELIETFESRENSEFFSEKNFPGFPSRKEENPSRLYSSMKEAFEKPHENDAEHETDSLKTPKTSIDHKTETPRSEKKDQQKKENFDLSLVAESLYGKSKTENERSFQSLQNLYYLEVDRRVPFGIGEFGDISCCRVGKSQTRDLNKPRDHGDGVQEFKSSKVVFVKPEKKEKEMKTQRQLWTELREDFRDLEPFSNDLFPLTETEPNLNRFIPLGLKTSKSDNCINRKVSECYSSTTFDLSHDNNKLENIENKLLENDSKSDSNPAWKNAAEHSSSESLYSPKDEEFECERTPRLSRSLSNLDAQLNMERLNEIGSLGVQFFENLEISKEQKESVNLSIFLARKTEEEMAVKENNWLSLKSQGTKKSNRRDKKAKTREKKGSHSSEEHFDQYLTRRSRPSVPSLKLRRSNCFQNFYKRFISVFCVTSNSSAATSK